MIRAWAVRMAEGYWVGIWNDKEIAESICAKQPKGHRDTVVEMVEAGEAQAVAWMWDQATYPDKDVRGRGWHPVMGNQEPTDYWMVRNVVPLYTRPPERTDCVVVPAEPTEAMIKAGVKAFQHTYNANDPSEDWKAMYRAMLAAAGQK